MDAVLIGNFDGVHLGHQALVRAARQEADVECVIAVTFDAHPRTLLGGGAPALLTLPAERLRLLCEAGATRVESLRLDEELLGRSPEDFIQWLHRRIPFGLIVEGADFRFGRARSGDVRTLEASGARLGFRTLVANQVEVSLCDGNVVGARSSLIRWLLERGRVADAARVLGRPHIVEGPVVRGAQRGRELGFPTANVDPCGIMLPADGVYAVEVTSAGGERWRGAASIGSNPTFGEQPRTLEVHLLGVGSSLDLYGRTIRVHFLRWIRGMVRFDSVDSLVEQMARDCEKVEA
ncbi:MAG: riboflavin biosynthesis protein RibF [Planctomycetes bacterium]|nr:riboflavin biosynthesis protein RibF [Planctomycetota bacterium]